MRTLLLCLPLVACATVPARMEPFACRGEPFPRDFPEPSPRAASIVGEPAAPSVERVGAVAADPLATRLRIHATHATVGALGVAIAERIGQPVIVDSALVDIPIALTVPEASAQEILRSLADVLDATINQREGRPILLELRERALQRLRSEMLSQTFVALEVRVYPTAGRRDPRDVAAAYCRMFASPRGSAAVIDDAIVARDVIDRLSELERMLAALERPSGDRAASPPASSPAP